MSTPIPGWYSDPAGTPQLRWWDGNQWTDQYRPGDTATPTQSAAPATSSPIPNATSTNVQPPLSATQFVPAAPKPRGKATGGQIAIAAVTSILVLIFAATSALTGFMFARTQHDRRMVQDRLSSVQLELMKAQEEAK